MLQLMYELSLFSGLSHDEACNRSLPVLLQSCAIQLNRDLVNKQVDYLNSPLSQGSTGLYTLQQLFNISLQKCTLNDSLRIQCYKLLALVGAAQHAEISTHEWDTNKVMLAAKGLKGYQYEAYFSIVTAGTEQHDELQALGHSYGIVNHIADDISQSKASYTLLAKNEKAAIRAWAMAHAKKIVEADIQPLIEHLPALLEKIH